MNWFRSLLPSRFQGEPTFEGLPDLAEDVNDNAYLAAAVKAADADRSSGAYDQFLFTENSQKQMPFETAVDDHIGLLTLRLSDKWRRVFLRRANSGLKAKSRASKYNNRRAWLQGEAHKIQVQIDAQESILQGSKTGENGLDWSGATPVFVSVKSGFVRVFLPTLTILLIAAVDLGVIFVSLEHLPGFRSREALIFTLPALAVQLVFPHLIGKRINWDIHGHPKKLRNRFEMGLILVLWLTFLVVMTQVRVTYIFAVADGEGKRAEVEALFTVLWLANFLMLLGLGSWILFDAARSNPHKHEVLRLYVRQDVLANKLRRLERKVEDASEYLKGLEAAALQAEESYREAVLATGQSLRLAAKSVYRRALVNGVGDSRFTASYLDANPDVARSPK